MRPPAFPDNGDDGQLVAELRRVSAIFQARAIAAVLGVPADHSAAQIADRSDLSAPVSVRLHTPGVSDA